MPALVFLPGLHGTRDLFGPLLAHVPAEMPAQFVEYPCDRCDSYAGHLARVERQVQGLSDLVLFAESFSGPLAIHFAARHSRRVRALVLCGTFITAPVPPILCYLATPLILLRCPLPGIGIRFFLAGTRAPAALVAATHAAVRRVRPLVLAQRVRQAAWLDAREALRRLTVPTLVLHGTRDRLIGRRAMRRIRRVRPDLPAIGLDAPHLLLQNQPAAVWSHVQRFLETCQAPAPTPDGPAVAAARRMGLSEGAMHPVALQHPPPIKNPARAKARAGCGSFTG